jgi:hypothetical protein
VNVNEGQWDLAGMLVDHPNWAWAPGMRMRTADERVLGWFDGALPEPAWPDLGDFATGGALLGVLDALGILVDVAREGEEWIVAVETEEGLKGWAADTLAEAAGWALLQSWDAGEST